MKRKVETSHKNPYADSKKELIGKKVEGIKYFFWILVIASLLLLISPLLLNNALFREAAVKFTSALGKETYKEGYIGLIGGLIGSALGVVGALFVMHTEQKKEMLYTIRVNARITYYDIELFYVEFASLGKLFLENQNPQTPEILKQKDGLGLLINPNWISTVAELGDKVLSFDQVHRLYVIYGVMQRLDAVLQTLHFDDENTQTEKIHEIKTLFQQLGRLNADKTFTYHICPPENGQESQSIVIGDVMELLRKQIR